MQYKPFAHAWQNHVTNRQSLKDMLFCKSRDRGGGFANRGIVGGGFANRGIVGGVFANRGIVGWVRLIVRLKTLTILS